MSSDSDISRTTAVVAEEESKGVKRSADKSELNVRIDLLGVDLKFPFF